MLWVAAVFVAAFAFFPTCLGAILGAGEEPSSPVATGMMVENPNAMVLPVAGMTCEACAMSLQKSLAAVPGVAQAEVDYAGEQAIVLPDAGKAVTRDSLVEAVERSGYEVEEAETTDAP